MSTINPAMIAVSVAPSGAGGAAGRVAHGEGKAGEGGESA